MTLRWLLLHLFLFAAVGRSFGDTQLESGPVHRGTINVVVANDKGIVVLTDSMVTAVSIDEHGVRTEHQLAEPARKLFQIDDRTVCTIAGFGSADTPSVPRFLNSSSAIMGRFQDRLKNFTSLSVADKLALLENLFRYYLPAVANIRDDRNKENYLFELLIAGYDPDGTPEMGRLVMTMAESQGAVGPILSPVTRELHMIPIHGSPPPLFAGIEEIAQRIADNPSGWSGDKAILAYAEAKRSGNPLTTEQMKAFAISLKQHTADAYREVGGPDQIAVLSAGRVQSFDQPRNLPPVALTSFQFQIVNGLSVEGYPEDPVKRSGSYGALVSDCFALYINNSFTGVRQEIGDGYYSKNVFNKSLVSYKGGRLDFETSNQVIASDLLIGAKVRRDSPEVKQLREDFKWRSVEFQRDDTPPVFRSAGAVFTCKGVTGLALPF
jgi:20S proteasome alpha/beta subunit